jgi:hypothetical protein
LPVADQKSLVGRLGVGDAGDNEIDQVVQRHKAAPSVQKDRLCVQKTPPHLRQYLNPDLIVIKRMYHDL